MNLKDRLNRQLEIRKQSLSYRALSLTGNLTDFTSNDYLGLARSGELALLINSLNENAHRNGSTGSRLLSGNSVLIETTETQLCTIFRSEKALIFNSGYNANIAALSSIPQRGDTIIYDELSHASIKDGARLSLAKRLSFKHNNLEDLELKVRSSEGNVFIVVESVYSMDGDFCPLEELVGIAEKYGSHIILDEAHTTGLIGKSGSGLAVKLGLEKDILIRIYTFGKAMGIHGACVVCNSYLAEYLINFSRPFIYTTALSPHSILSISGAFTYLAKHEDLQKTAENRIQLFNKLFTAEIGDQLKRPACNHPIQAIIIPGIDRVKAAASNLQSSGYDVRPILSPTVKSGEERLRICLHTFNSDDDISGLIHSLAALI
ncbi:aminotransferase class I/II-fold pyridoxal phosphate-dependent enzyme [Fulvivirga sp. 29W222]|uniref:Aminotransferase class I/II-fold pyridoxal phosphate-dependent enzyme n=1 Tax=Fulvivirga marina TaxID=2494733 RepID=A0A937G166_9BACT|nr:aminotransferase class I/II-fold pyridoxal phosphate-dependent enzyme [Fulvivirga marina]MBL6448193.1 aminotransferase class I/II-fold pyridoxal phosphate-dependent enzyme [Fulvivirga marina]